MLRQEKGRKNKSVYIFKLSLSLPHSLLTHFLHTMGFIFFLFYFAFLLGLFIWPAKRSAAPHQGKVYGKFFFFFPFLSQLEEGKTFFFFLSFSCFVCTHLPCVPYIKKAHECFSITFHVSFCLFSLQFLLLHILQPNSTRRRCRMDGRVIERTYIYVFMTRACWRIAFHSLKLNFHSSFENTAMCAFLPHILKGISFLGL